MLLVCCLLLVVECWVMVVACLYMCLGFFIYLYLSLFLRLLFYTIVVCTCAWYMHLDEASSVPSDTTINMKMSVPVRTYFFICISVALIVNYIT